MNVDFGLTKQIFNQLTSLEDEVCSLLSCRQSVLLSGLQKNAQETNVNGGRCGIKA